LQAAQAPAAASAAPPPVRDLFYALHLLNCLVVRGIKPEHVAADPQAQQQRKASQMKNFRDVQRTQPNAGSSRRLSAILTSPK
jgi:hypothetical protein